MSDEKEEIVNPADVKRPSEIKLDKNPFPENEDKITPVEIIGRCHVCSIAGTLEYEKGIVATKDIDNILAYKPVKCWCPKCKGYREFLPIQVRKYPDVPGLSKIQAGFKKGIVK